MAELTTIITALLNKQQRNSSYLFNIARNLSEEIFNLADKPEVSTRETLIIVCYTLIVVISIFGNFLVCNVVARNHSMRSATYVFIANLAVSDLTMTVLNIPFNIARILLSKWPFGGFMCSFVPLVQVTSVYVSTFTMMCIALDRYQVITKPLRPRLRSHQAILVTILVWIVAIVLSLPNAIFNEVIEVFTYRLLIRCRTIYPTGLGKWITLFTFATQYVTPLSVTGIVYWRIMMQVWSRDALGAVTEAQLVTQAKAKRKTIKMLVLVVILFAICWLPLNLYHMIVDFSEGSPISLILRNSTVFFVCHWLAMSSVCYNPFIYCWLNDHFRSGARAWLRCIKSIGSKVGNSLRSRQATNEFQLTYRSESERCQIPSASSSQNTILFGDQPAGIQCNSFRLENTVVIAEKITDERSNSFQLENAAFSDEHSSGGQITNLRSENAALFKDQLSGRQKSSESCRFGHRFNGNLYKTKRLSKNSVPSGERFNTNRHHCIASGSKWMYRGTKSKMAFLNFDNRSLSSPEMKIEFSILPTKFKRSSSWVV